MAAALTCTASDVLHGVLLRGIPVLADVAGRGRLIGRDAGAGVAEGAAGAGG